MDRQIHNLPNLDLEQLLTEGVAVVCYEKEEAKILIECMWRDMPQRMSGWESRDPHWNNEPTIYTLWYKTWSGWTPGPGNHLMQGTLRNHKDQYECIPFSDLILQSEIEESDMSIEFLLR